jgi:hypothetical protein
MYILLVVEFSWGKGGDAPLPPRNCSCALKCRYERGREGEREREEERERA